MSNLAEESQLELDFETFHFDVHTEIDMLEIQDSLSPEEELKLKDLKKLRLWAKDQLK